MQKIFATLLLTMFIAASSDLRSESRLLAMNQQIASILTQNRIPKSYHDFPILTKRGKMIFNFTLDSISFPPGTTPLLFRAYIVAPNGRRTNGPKIDGHSAISAFSIIVEPPILFGTYTIVVENLNIPGNTQTFINQTVIVTNSLNTKQAKTIVTSPTNTPGDPGNTVMGYFNPVHSFFAH